MADDASSASLSRTTLEDGVALIRLPSPFHWHAHNWVMLRGLWDEIEALHPDIVHAHNVVTLPTWQVLAGNRSRRIPLVLDDHNNYFNIEPYTWKKRLFYAAFRHVLRPMWMGSVGRVMPMSHEVRRLIGNEFGINASLTTLVHLGADPERFRRDLEAGRATRKELGIPEDAIVVVNAGKMTPSKDCHVLIDAMGAVVAREPRAWLLTIGNASAEYRRLLESKIAEAKLDGRMTWIGFADNAALPRYYSAADLGVWPGDWSVTVLEAASCGLPLVLPDREYARYSIKNHNGIMFERGKADGLAQALLTLVEDESARVEMGARSRELIERELNWDAIAQQTVGVYRDVIEAAS